MSAKAPRIPRLRLDLGNDSVLQLDVTKRWDTDHRHVVTLSLGTRISEDDLVDVTDGVTVLEENVIVEASVQIEYEDLDRIAQFLVVTASTLERTRYRQRHHFGVRNLSHPEDQVELAIRRYEDLATVLEMCPKTVRRFIGPWIEHAKDGFEIMQSCLEVVADKPLAQRIRDWMKREQFRECS